MTDNEKSIRQALSAGPLAALHCACNHKTITALLAELDALRADAERYRWLCDNIKNWSWQPGPVQRRDCERSLL